MPDAVYVITRKLCTIKACRFHSFFETYRYAVGNNSGRSVCSISVRKVCNFSILCLIKSKYVLRCPGDAEKND